MFLGPPQQEDAVAQAYRTGKGPNEEELPDNDETLASFRTQSAKMMGADAAERDFTGEVCGRHSFDQGGKAAAAGG